MRQNESPDNIIPVSGGTQTAGQVVQYAEEPQQEVAGARTVDAAGVQAGVNALAMDAAGVQAGVNALAMDAADAQVADGAETDASGITDVQPAEAGGSGQDEEQNAQTGDEPEYMIDAEGLVKIYKTKETEVLALSGLDLKIQKGEFTALIGNSGSGKSTFLNMIGGLDVPSAGKLYVGGKNLFRMTERERVRYKRDTVGFVWQNNARNLFPYLTAIDNVCIPMRISGLKHKKQKEVEELRRQTDSVRDTVADLEQDFEDYGQIRDRLHQELDGLKTEAFKRHGAVLMKEREIRSLKSSPSSTNPDRPSWS